MTNAKRNNVKNISFYNEDAGKFMVEMAEKKESADVVIMDQEWIIKRQSENRKHGRISFVGC